MGLNTERNAEILKRIDAGQSFGEVARAMGLTRSLVAGVCWRSTTPRPGPRHVRGEQNPASKLTWAHVADIRLRRAAGETLAMLAADYGVHIQTIWEASKGHTWKQAA